MKEASLGTLGGFRLVRRIGRGETTEAFEARAVGAAGVTKTLCVKIVLSPFSRDRRFLKAFAGSARASMALQHGNIVQTLDLGREDGEIYLAMELVDGPSLAALRDELDGEGRRLPPALAVHVVKEVCQALEYAHNATDAKGRPLSVIHGDVSPRNVLVSFDGQVKVVDFGMGNAIRAGRGGGGMDDRATYMAPEQLEEGAMDPRVDVYGAGALMFELLAGRPPSAASQGGAPPALDELAPWVDPALCAIVETALALDPSQRYPSMLALEEMLSKYLHDQGESIGDEGLASFVRETCIEELREQGRSTGETPVKKPRFARSSLSGGHGSSLAKIAIAGSMLVGIALAAGLFVIRESPSDGPSVREVAVRSSPPGARVLVDGDDSGVFTNGILRGLDPSVEHEISMRLAGYEEKTKTLMPGQETISFSLKRSLRAPSQREPAMVPGVREESRPVRRRFIEEEEREGERILLMDRRASLIEHASLPSSGVELDPRLSHTLQVTEGVQVALVRAVGRLAWFALDEQGDLVGHGNVSPRERASIPAGTARLLVLRVQGGRCDYNVGEATATVRARGRIVHRLTVDGRSDCLSISGNSDAELHDLLEEPGYRLTYQGPDGGPRLFFSASSPNPMALSRDGDEATNSLLPGEEAEFYYVASLYFATFQETESQERLVVRLEAMGPPSD